MAILPPDEFLFDPFSVRLLELAGWATGLLSVAVGLLLVGYAVYGLAFWIMGRAK